MPIKQMIKCSICDEQEIEETPGMGFVGWGSLNGVILDGEENPTLCSFHLGKLADYLDELKMMRGT